MASPEDGSHASIGVFFKYVAIKSVSDVRERIDINDMITTNSSTYENGSWQIFTCTTSAFWNNLESSYT